MHDIESTHNHSIDSKKLAGALNGKLELFYNMEPRIARALIFLDNVRSSSGGYPARNPGDGPSVATTAIVCIAKKKAKIIGKHIDPKTQEDVNFLLNQFDDTTQSWRIFRSEISSNWATSLCIWALSILGSGNEACVKSAMDKLLSYQRSGGWGVTSENSNEMLITYIATRSLIAYCSNVGEDPKIIKALKQSAEFFRLSLDEKIKNLNVTDCALALQGLDDIYSMNILNISDLNFLEDKALDHIHNLISNKKYMDVTKIVYQVGSAEWPIYHFHPAVLPIIYKHRGDSPDVYELLNYFAINFEDNGTGGMWKHFANGDSTYTTALAVYALCDLFNNTNVMDFFKMMYLKMIDIEEENRRLDNLYNNLKNDSIKALWARIRDNKIAAFVANYSGAISAIVILIGFILTYKDTIMQFISTHK